MKTSETITTIAAALLKAQAAMTFAAKNAKNPHFKSKYADLPAVIEAVKPALNNQGIVFVQGISGNDGGIVVTTRLMHTSGEWIEDALYLPVPQATAQAYGSAITYGRRYGLQSIVGLPADDDDGNSASGVQEEQKPRVPESQTADLKADLDSAANVSDLKDKTRAALAATQHDTEAYQEIRSYAARLAERLKAAA